MIAASSPTRVAYATRQHSNHGMPSSRAHTATLESLAATVTSVGDTDARLVAIGSASRALGAPEGVWKPGSRQARMIESSDNYGGNGFQPRNGAVVLNELAVAALGDRDERHAHELVRRDNEVTTLQKRVKELEARPIVDPQQFANLRAETENLMAENSRLGQENRSHRERHALLLADWTRSREETAGTPSRSRSPSRETPEHRAAAVPAAGGTRKEAADAAGVSDRTVRRWTAEGRLPKSDEPDTGPRFGSPTSLAEIG